MTKTNTTSDNNKKCKCECHLSHPYNVGTKEKPVMKKIRSPLCSICMENHKRSKYYKGMKSIAAMTNKILGRMMK